MSGIRDGNSGDIHHVVDAEGRWIIGNLAQGCRYCGTVGVKGAANGKAVVYHPGVECCFQSLTDQIRYREDEMRALHRRIDAHLADLDRLEETVQAYGASHSAAAAEANLRLERARRGIGRQIAALKGELPNLDNEEQTGIRQLELEVARLTRKRVGLRKGERA